MNKKVWLLALSCGAALTLSGAAQLKDGIYPSSHAVKVILPQQAASPKALYKKYDREAILKKAAADKTMPAMMTTISGTATATKIIVELDMEGASLSRRPGSRRGMKTCREREIHCPSRLPPWMIFASTRNAPRWYGEGGRAGISPRLARRFCSGASTG